MRRVRGLNSQIQKIKSSVCSFRNTEHFKTAIYFQCGELDLPDSDLDLLIIEESDLLRYRRLGRYRRVLCGVFPAKDIVVWTRKKSRNGWLCQMPSSRLYWPKGSCSMKDRLAQSVRTRRGTRSEMMLLCFRAEDVNREMFTSCGLCQRNIKGEKGYRLRRRLEVLH